VKVKGTPIKGFSRYTTDGVRVYLRTRRLPQTGDVYRLIPDNGDGINLADITVKLALAGGDENFVPKTNVKQVKKKALKKADLIAIANENDIQLPKRATVKIITALVKHLL